LLKRNSHSLNNTGMAIINKPFNPSVFQSKPARNHVALITSVSAMMATCQPNISMNSVAPRMWKLKPGRMPALNCQKMNAPMMSATSAFTMMLFSNTLRHGAWRAETTTKPANKKLASHHQSLANSCAGRFTASRKAMLGISVAGHLLFQDGQRRSHG
jgi:hypothetical protein